MKTAEVPSVEPLEARIAPATIVGLNSNNGLFTFDSETPGTTSATVAITGLGAGQVIKTIDFRPATGGLYGVAISGAAAPFTGQLYTIDVATGAATAVGAAFSTALSTATGYGMDFNPTVDRIRVVNSFEENIRLNPDTGVPVVDTNITGASNLSAIAYTNNYAGALSTTLYGVEFTTDDLVTLGGLNSNPSPNGGVVTKVKDINVTTSASTADRLGLDILTTLEGNTAFYTGVVGGSQGFYKLNLTTGAASPVGTIGGGATAVFDIAVQPLAALSFPDGKSFTYTDADGDLVTVKTTAGTLKSSQFSWLTSADGTRRELTRMNIANDTTFTGAGLTFSAKKTATGGDGRVDIGWLDATGLDLGAVKVGGNLERIDAGSNSATVPALKSLATLGLGHAAGSGDLAVAKSLLKNQAAIPSITITGDLNGAELTAKVAKFKITGSIIGGEGQGSGVVSATVTKAFTLGGSIVGGDGTSSAFTAISAPGGTVKIGGSIVGGSGTSSGVASISAKTFTLGGSLVGGSGLQSGSLAISFTSALSIGGSIVGGSGSESGTLQSGSSTASSVISVGGSVTGDAALSGRVIFGDAASVKIGGSIVGGPTGISGFVQVGKVGTFTLGGSIVAGLLANSLSGELIIETAKTVVIKGSLIGNTDNPAIIGVRGNTAPGSAAESIAIGSLTIGGSMVNGQILIGGPQNNPNAAAGKIAISGDFLASSIVAGFREGTDGFFGTDDDVAVAMDTLPAIKAAIASIIIKGRATGTASDGDHCGIVVESLGSVSIAGRKLALDPAVQDNLVVGAFADFRVRERTV